MGPRRKLAGNSDLLWVVIGVLVCAVFVGILLRYLQMRHEVYRLGYRVAALTEEHSLLLEENRCLVVEAALQGNAERLEAEALERLGLREANPDQMLAGAEE